ncbi:MAG TPA: response regulator transcription factor [Candidatus Saccharimonadales bacterium]|nr:response regulator transcription factor [Candidatus Saccharimonadales bacterium]
MNKTRLLIMDEHAVVREGIKTIINLQPDMRVVAEAESGKALIPKALEHKAQAVILEIGMPDFCGAHGISHLLQCCPGLKVVVFTSREERTLSQDALRAGAMGYILKSSPKEELVRAIRSVMAGELFLDPILAGTIVRSMIERKPGSGGLSEREETVVRLIAQGYYHKEIASRLRVSVKTIETYKVRSMEKLKLRNRNDFVRYAMHHGWLSNV